MISVAIGSVREEGEVVCGERHWQDEGRISRRQWTPSEKAFPSYLMIMVGASFDQIIRSDILISIYSTYRLAALSTDGQAVFM